MCTFILNNNAFAGTCSGVETSIINCEEGGDGGIWHILSLVIDIFSIGVGILSLIGIAVFGVQYLTAGGDINKTTKAKNRLINVAIGLVAYVLLWTGTQWLLPGGKLNWTSDSNDIEISFSKTSLNIGELITSQATFSDKSINDKTYSLYSNNKDIVDVTASNTLRCLKQGEATVYAKSANGSKSKEVKITCTAPAPESNPSDKPSETPKANFSKNPEDYPNIDTKNGLTLKQANDLIAKYRDPKNKDSILSILSCDNYSAYYGGKDPATGTQECKDVWANAASAARCNGNGDVLANCTVFTNFFLSKFTNLRYQYQDGASVIKPLENGVKGKTLSSAYPSLSIGSTPKPFSVFSGGSGGEDWGHTGIILGNHNGEWIVGQAACFNYYNDENLGVVRTASTLGSGSPALNGLSGTIYYAYPEIDYAALQKYLYE